MNIIEEIHENIKHTISPSIMKIGDDLKWAIYFDTTKNVSLDDITQKLDDVINEIKKVQEKINGYIGTMERQN